MTEQTAAEQARYSEPFDYASRRVVKCRDCSSRSSMTVVAVDDVAEHDALHAASE